MRLKFLLCAFSAGVDSGILINVRIFLLLVVSVFAFNPSDSFAEDAVVAPTCKDLVFDALLNFSECKNQVVPNATDALINAAKEKAQDMLKAEAINYLASFVPAGSFVATLLGRKAGGPSEIQAAVGKILEAIKISEGNILSGVNKIFEAYDYAAVNALKDNVGFYFNSTVDDQRRYFQQLFDLSNSASSVRRAFEVHTDVATHGGKIIGAELTNTYHSYLGLVALQMTLRQVYRQYEVENSPDPIVAGQGVGTVLRDDFRTILGNGGDDKVFSYINHLDWRLAAKTQLAKIGSEKSISYASGDYAPDTQWGYEYKYLVGNVQWTVGVVTWIGDGVSLFTKYRSTAYLYSNSTSQSFDRALSKRVLKRLANKTNLKTAACPKLALVSGATQCFYWEYPSNSVTVGNDPIRTEGANPLHVKKIFVEHVAETIIAEAYASTQKILDNWWALAENPGSRPWTEADQIAILYNPHYDTDEDGIVNSDETLKYGTMWDYPDSDGNGVNDGYEIACGFSATSEASQDANSDQDGDGFNLWFEGLFGSDCKNASSTPFGTLAAKLVPSISLILN